jgi:hypothetical protein
VEPAGCISKRTEAVENAGGDTTTSIKQGAEFGLSGQMTLAGPQVNINRVQALAIWDNLDTPRSPGSSRMRCGGSRLAGRHPEY